MCFEPRCSCILLRKPAAHFLEIIGSFFESKQTILEDFRGTGMVEVLAEESEQPWAAIALIKNIANDGLDLFGRFQLPLVRGTEELTHPIIVQRQTECFRQFWGLNRRRPDASASPSPDSER